MTMYEIIEAKKHSKELTKEQIEFMIKKYVDGSIPDYQMSAFCMAVYFNGLTDEEIKHLTLCMAWSGDTVDLSCFGELSCDKHSSGGVGDKTTLIVAPIVATLGGVVAKMSGRGLGHTGGTVDKLESIPGYRTELSPDEFMDISRRCSVCVCAQSGNLVPADKKLYALRDVTATVDSMGLIVSSIMSKKLASGSKNIVLDVKCGSGAFMKTLDEARVLASGMVKIGKMCNRNISALITDMDVPLGYAVGNSLEVIEAIDVLKGKIAGDIKEVSISLASQLVKQIKNISSHEAKLLCLEAVDSGKAFLKFKEWINLQGGNAEFADDTSLFKKAPFERKIVSPKEGFIKRMNAEKVGICSCQLGAGRKTKTDIIDLSAGLILAKKTGDFVNKGEVVATLYSSDSSLFDTAEEIFMSSLEFSDKKPDKNPVIIETVE